MTVPLVLFDDTPRARRDDPVTSHAAADKNDTAGSRRAVLLIMYAYDRPLADHEIEAIHNEAGGKYTGQRLRTARDELVDDGRVIHDSEVIGPKGSACWTWRLTTAAEREKPPTEKRPRARRSHAIANTKENQ
ncbi:hypothetical protein [Microbacterium trichothecenolyticum]|uniref:Uncharacterized protein n=1 Tax=Microbacterium trichothecenolyticum TaxID=69370 RepID=A0A0M2HMF7_MICTR|nr:hypothetical protein [Microbacterium trichothecenolyticum]KJL45609.1 hypothetical protein RS82_00161 [Microbacterium trichothecenolyticum]